MRVRRGPATVTARATRRSRTLPGRRQTRDADPEEGPPCAARRSGSRPRDPAAVHLRHRPALRPRQRRRLPAGQPDARSTRTCRPCSTARTSSSSASSAGAGPGRRGSTRCSPPAAGRRARRRAGAGRRADGAVHRAGRGRRRGARLPGAGRPGNLAQLHNFLSDTVLLTGEGSRRRVERRPGACSSATRTAHGRPDRRRPLLPRPPPRREHRASSRRCCAAIEDAGGRALPVFCASLRPAEPELLQTLRAADALVVTVLAAGGTQPADASAGGDDEAWDVGALAALDVPILQGLCLTSSRATWADNDDGLSPLDVATQVAIPEFDGRLITVPFSFKEIDADGLTVYVADPERAARVAGIAVRHARLRHIPNADKRIVLMLSAYPTKHARIGNAVGLDTPASAVALLTAMAKRRVTTSGELPGVAEQDGDALIHALIAAGGQDPDWLTEEQLAGNPIRISAATYAALVRHAARRLPQGRRVALGPGARRAVRRTSGDIVLAALRSGNVVVMVQPPRGFGENPIAIYHDPDLPPSHHYLAAYRWLARGRGVRRRRDGARRQARQPRVAARQDAGHVARRAAPDAALGDLPLVYPFLVNDPGEGTQAKRRAHATLVDHLVPPMARAETYGDIARLEQLLDEHANIAALDPAKLPAIRAQIWTLIQAAKLDHDLGLNDRPDDDGFDDFLLHVDGWLCEIKDVQIRDGLHVLGAAPAGDRRGSTWCSRCCAPGRCGAASRPARPARGAGPDRRGTQGPRGRGRGAGARPGRRPWRPPAGTRTPPRRSSPTCARTAHSRCRTCRLARKPPRVGTNWRAKARSRHTRPSRSSGCCGSPRPRSCPGSTRPPTSSRASCTPSTAATSRPGRAARRCAGWSTCCRPAATSTPSTRRPCRPASPGRPARRWPTRWSSATGRHEGEYPSASASPCGARPPCAPPATTSPRSSRCSASGRSGTRRRAGSPGSR